MPHPVFPPARRQHPQTNSHNTLFETYRQHPYTLLHNSCPYLFLLLL